jgi:hypothetical protein
MKRIASAGARASPPGGQPRHHHAGRIRIIADTAMSALYLAAGQYFPYF